MLRIQAQNFLSSLAGTFTSRSMCIPTEGMVNVIVTGNAVCLNLPLF